MADTSGADAGTMAAIMGILGMGLSGGNAKTASQLKDYEATKEKYSPWTKEHGQPVPPVSQANDTIAGLMSGLSMAKDVKGISKLFGIGGAAGAVPSETGLAGAGGVPDGASAAFGAVPAADGSEAGLGWAGGDLGGAGAGAGANAAADGVFQGAAAEGGGMTALTDVDPKTGRAAKPVVVGNSQPNPGPKTQMAQNGSSATNARDWNLQAQYNPYDQSQQQGRPGTLRIQT